MKAGDAVDRLDSLDPHGLLGAIPTPIMLVDLHHIIHFINFAGQAFFSAGESTILGTSLEQWLPADSPLFQSIDQAIAQQASVTDNELPIETPRIGRHQVTATIGPIAGPKPMAIVQLQQQGLAARIDNVLHQRSAARQVTGMAAMLAHEVKNPLSGIRGAAQLLEQTASDADRELTRLICDEVDRIRALVDRMEVFSDRRPMPREPINIHSVLERVRKVAQAGFAAQIRFVEQYDPSLPPVVGNFDQLVQIFLNLVKNAAEALPESGGEIVLGTRYQRGMRIVLPGSGARVHLPLAITVQDNGPGVPAELQDSLFDPFISGKTNGSGLGLALVAKLIGDHGGTISFESEPRRTVFKVSLPISAPASSHRTPQPEHDPA